METMIDLTPLCEQMYTKTCRDQSMYVRMAKIYKYDTTSS